jgi:uncharacterized protein YndB with AHSA1/START domain
VTVFDVSAHTSAERQMTLELDYRGHSAEEVFAIMGDPERIPDWYTLANRVDVHEDGSFDVYFTFFGQVYEEVLHLDEPHRYLYLAHGPDFPIKDYIGLIEVEPTSANTGVLRWSLYFDTIEGDEFQRIMPGLLDGVNRASFELLATMVGGSNVRVAYP